MPKVLNRRHQGIPTGSVYIGRPTKFGNPFRSGRDGTRQEVIAMYAHWLHQQPHLIQAAKQELRGKDLVCWCAPLACHADVLLAVANSEEE